MNSYDLLIVGSGIFGSVFAQQATEHGLKCLIIDKRSHNAGNAYTENVHGINVHKYGPHIFWTPNTEVWEYANRFAKFNHFTNRVKVNNQNKIYSFPINLLTMHQMFGCNTPEEAVAKLDSVRLKIENPSNLEEHLLSTVGEEIYHKFFYGYTKKQWGREPRELPKSIITRIPIRTNFDDNYLFDCYQGVPIGGYTKMLENMQVGCDLILNEDYLQNRESWDSVAKKVVYTGALDEFCDYKYGELEYRSLRFEESILNKKDYQGCAIMNFTEESVPHTRIVEHKHFEFGKQDVTVISKEFPQSWERGKEKYYPINDEKNTYLYQQYRSLFSDDSKYIFGGRLAEYRYYDMHQVISSAIHKFKKFIGKP